MLDYICVVVLICVFDLLFVYLLCLCFRVWFDGYFGIFCLWLVVMFVVVVVAFCSHWI